MADNKYCSTCFKTGEELDAALQKAIVCDDNAVRAEAARTVAEECATRAEEAAERAEQSGGVDPELENRVGELEQQVSDLVDTANGAISSMTERVEALEQQDQTFIQQATELVSQVETIGSKVTTLEETAESAMGSMLAMGLRLNALETPATLVDMSAFESEGKIVETHADGSIVTYTMTFDENGNPVKITAVTKNGEGEVLKEAETTLTW